MSGYAAKQEEPRELIEVCEDMPNPKRNESEFIFRVSKNTVYCNLGLDGRPILCEYMAKFEDRNGLRPCLNPLYYSDKGIIEKLIKKFGDEVSDDDISSVFELPGVQAILTRRENH
ncbi:hypothetical protein GOV05_04555 [Candidatus Woesearchaeota archaeon]|nr:hypothetical protein [Candidatus Woesearchaeota archaeon]